MALDGLVEEPVDLGPGFEEAVLEALRVVAAVGVVALQILRAVVGRVGERHLTEEPVADAGVVRLQRLDDVLVQLEPDGVHELLVEIEQLGGDPVTEAALADRVESRASANEGRFTLANGRLTRDAEAHRLRPR